MAIRIISPIPLSPTVRTGLRQATRRTRDTLEKRRRALFAGRGEALALPDSYLRLRWQDELTRTRALFTEFYDRYDGLVGLLCAAAQDGIAPGMEEEYRERRTWFVANYRQAKRFVKPFLAIDPSDRRGRRPCDGFEALYAPASIGAMLTTDGGNLIGRLMRTQEALGAWETDLRRQEQILRM